MQVGLAAVLEAMAQAREKGGHEPLAELDEPEGATLHPDYVVFRYPNGVLYGYLVLEQHVVECEPGPTHYDIRVWSIGGELTLSRAEPGPPEWN